MVPANSPPLLSTAIHGLSSSSVPPHTPSPIPGLVSQSALRLHAMHSFAPVAKQADGGAAETDAIAPDGKLWQSSVDQRTSTTAVKPSSGARLPCRNSEA